MFGLPLAFAAPAVLAALIGLVGLYFLLRLTPPTPNRAIFPPLRLLIGLNPNETTPARTPWPILALRLAIGALIILAMAEPLWNSFTALSGSGPLLVLIDDGFAAAPAWDPGVVVLTTLLATDTGVRSRASSESTLYCGVCTPTL